MAVTDTYYPFTALTKKTKISTIFWLTLSIAVATVYSVIAVLPTFQHQYIIQDDARQHIFWMQRFIDNQLFPKDLIADYFESIAPHGYKAFYQILAVAGINPILVSKILPVLLGIMTTVYCFGICVEILPIPLTGFLGTLILNQSLWLGDDIISATSRAFLYPFFFALAYYLLKRSLLPCLVFLALLGLFYPGFVLISIGVLILPIFKFDNGLLRLSREPSDYWFCGLGIVVGFGSLLPYFLNASPFGSLISVKEARTLPEFLSSGRMSFFHDDNPWRFWLSASRAGLRISFNPSIVFLGVFLPLLLRLKSRFPLAQQVSKNIYLLIHLIITSLFLFFAAHILLFKLYLPSRFTVHSSKIVLALTTAIALTLILDAILTTNRKRKLLAIFLILIISIFTVFYPNIFWKNKFPTKSYVIGQTTGLYQFLQQSPKDTIIASLVGEANNIPSFAQRPILVGNEYAIAYHVGYYRQFRQRLADLVRAHYSFDLADAQNLIKKYGVDFFLIDTRKTVFSPEYITNTKWLRQYLSPKLPDDMLAKLMRETLESLQKGTVPALSKVVQDCTAFNAGESILLDAGCVAKKKNSD
ncbi:MULTISPECIES: hypothetical protein [Nostocales]|uniref:Glycosyltransferase RgtA/B/C/D-like domain-containing protein n=3 Tax=Nostocales TaxID=1161 RepID=A0A0C1RFU9_9CYAN|nr:hypothetical protein [Tolypothrix bouteillei]KAF3887040.1 hypothetical protein DA73_0400017270 [Tolypothrix bouteillei VB521301]